MTSREAWLEMKSLEVWKNENQIFSNLTLTLNKGQNTILLGPNGSGKSAIVALINRTIYPIHKYNSEFKLFGHTEINIWNMRSKIGLISTEIDQRISGRDRVKEIIRSGLYQSFSMRNKKNLTNKDTNRVEKILREFKLSDISEKEYRILSDGQKRRVLIARAIVHNPEVLVLDEPTSKLDIKSRYILQECLENLAGKGTTILQITHDINSITKSYSRIIFIKKGRIIGDGNQSKQLTSKKLSNLFDLNLKIEKFDDYFKISSI
tara:strand:+ start:148 stop:939 length:792 start_codon:yes stop_codon:yes gene_type:complete